MGDKRVAEIRARRAKRWQRDGLGRHPVDIIIAEALQDFDYLDTELTTAQARIAELEGKLNTPELHDFSAAVVLEAAHQRNRWGASHDIGKEPQDWFWLLGYLGGKALRAALDDNQEKALHHCISTAAACANWHAAISGSNTEMRPGIDADAAAREISND